MAKPKRLRINSEQQIQRKLTEGRGGNVDEDYLPFLLIHDFSSIGRVSRVKIGNREAHMMSDLETAVLAELLWDQSVTKICEQVYLDREDTAQIAEKINVRHPKLSADQELHPFTTDLYYEQNLNGEVRKVAIAVKPYSEVTSSGKADAKSARSVERTLEKLEIERRYWLAQGVEWILRTDQNICKVKQRNIELLLNTEAPCREPGSAEWKKRLLLTVDILASGKNLPLHELAHCSLARRKLEAPLLYCVRFLCAQRVLAFEMTKPFGLDLIASDFSLTGQTIDAALFASFEEVMA
ncbi:hypothetical protein GRI44_02315 [Altererythrobacter confluentis]|uniref:TnsA endonuclease N-terminal domain-containing protein n=1 Tax=Allopontixanthobacter confluentis TaxID=1849021 RepID=A0A6L7GCA6_9SPHN|nr:TnsA endonuclease N-terminal domain-containing protein [Allopontixanthobacter confluentis]MXP13589.1 hypothetical protein [Allopontixanthobacter confluentis]